MARIYAPPSEIRVPEFDESAIKYLDELREWLKANGYEGEMVGEIVRWPRGDGFARYMVMKLRPPYLMHLPLGDAEHIPEAFARGLSADDIVAQVEHHLKQEKAQQELWYMAGKKRK